MMEHQRLFGPRYGRGRFSCGLAAAAMLAVGGLAGAGCSGTSELSAEQAEMLRTAEANRRSLPVEAAPSPKGRIYLDDTTADTGYQPTRTISNRALERIVPAAFTAAEAPKADAPKADAPKADAPKADAPKADAKPADAKPGDKPADAKPGDKPADGKPAETKPGEEPKKEEPPAPPSEKRLLAAGLETIGVQQFLDQYRISIYGHVAQTWMGNAGAPSDRKNALHLFDDRANDYRFNQLYHYVERTLSSGTGFDIGGRYAGNYGTDSRFIHSKGLLDKETDLFQYDTVEFYGKVRLPVGNGLTLQGGKFVTPVGYEVIDATGNDLASRGLLFTWAIPFTHTGGMATYNILMDEKRENPILSVTGGIFLGWDTFKDDNGSPTGYIGAAYTPDPKLNVLLNILFGPEQSGNRGDKRTLVNFIVSSQVTDRLKLVADVVLAGEQNARLTSNGLSGPGEAFWGGIAGYVIYGLGPDERPETLKAVLRAEWFDDHHGSRTGFAGSFYEFTFGLPWNPVLYRGDGYFMAPLIIQPEIRYDYFGGGGYDGSIGGSPFQAGSNRHQFTFGLQAIIKF